MVAIAGIAFAGILILMQLGFLDALFEGATSPHRTLDADLVVCNPRQKTFFSPKSFPRQRLYQVLGYEGVQSVSGLQVGTTLWRNPLTQQIRSILVFGMDPAHAAFKLEGVRKNIDRITLLNRVLFDRGSRPEFGPIARLFEKLGLVDTELNERRVRVAGLFTIGASFTADGTVITSDTTFANIFNRRRNDDIEVGLIKLNPGVDPRFVQRSLIRRFSNEVAVYTLDEFAELERSYWATSSGIGFIFGLGVFVGFIVGVVIVYQILYADVSDHMSEYATLKAMGYTDRYLLVVLLEESLILAVLGYIPGLAISMGMYWLAHSFTLLPIHMTIQRSLFVFFLTVVMCSISAAIAMRKLREADPADIF